MTTPPSGRWSCHQFTEYFAAVNDLQAEADVVGVAVERAAEAFDAEFAAVVVESTLEQSVGFGRDDDGFDLAHLKVGISAGAHPRFGSVGWLVAPLQGHGAASASVAGRLIVGRMNTPFVPEEEQMLRAMATVVGLVLRNLRSLRMERARQDVLRGLLDVQRSISTRRPLPEVLDEVTRATSELLGASASCLVLRPGTGAGVLSVVSRHTRTDPPMPSSTGLEAARRAMASRSLVTFVGGGAGSPSTGSPSTGSEQVVAVPVQIRGDCAGALVATHTGASHAAQEHNDRVRGDLLQMFAEQVSIALTDADTVARMNEALHDPLTGLASRALLLDRLDHAATVASRRGDWLTVLFLDLDGFKEVNDTHGHAVGDDVLRVIGSRIPTILRASDSAGRLGGDEFVVILEGLTPLDAESAATRLHRTLAEPITIAGIEIHIAASIGIAGERGGEHSAQDLLGLADAAMYRAKRLGPGRTDVHTTPRVGAEPSADRDRLAQPVTS